MQIASSHSKLPKSHLIVDGFCSSAHGFQPGEGHVHGKFVRVDLEGEMLRHVQSVRCARPEGPPEALIKPGHVLGQH